MQLVGEQGEEAGLAAAVGADDADFPAGVQLDGGVDDQWAAGAGEGDLAEGDHEGGNYNEALAPAAEKLSFCGQPEKTAKIQI